LNVKALIQKIPHSVKLAIVIVLAAKLLVLAVGYVTAYLNNGGGAPLSIAMDMFNRWDAPHYADIAKNWYVSNPTLDAYNFIVFFPLYPILIRLFTVDFSLINLSALIVANVCSLIAFIYLYKLAKLEFGEGVAVKAVLFLSVFPTAYFLSSPYTEGLFFAVVIASVYYARLGKWAIAGLMGMFAALSRLAGLLLLPVLLVEYLHQKSWKPLKTRLNVAWTFLPLAGFLIYLGINFQVTGSPFTFVTIEATHWSTRLDPLAGVSNMISWATTANYPENLTIGLAPLVFGVFGLLMVGVAVWRRMRPVYIAYMFLFWALAVATSWGISVPRYIIAMFPMFFLLGGLSDRKWINEAILLGSGSVLCYFTMLFALGWWAF
jgi:hypothetical protein